MSKRPTYGFPCVEDPNDFDPDLECCSPAEIETHRLACQTFGKPTYAPNKGCFSEYDAQGQLVRHVTRSSWGIGTNLIMTCDGCNEPVFDDPVIRCHECGRDLCEECWPKHDAKEDCE